MRVPTYLSNSSLQKFEQSREEFYLKYIMDDRPARIPQTRPMSVGSAFDAFVKSYLYKEVYGRTDPKFDFATLFESQVEEHNRDWARMAGAHVFAAYKKSGSCADLLLEMDRSTTEPVFELRLDTTVEGIPLVGFPDLRYTTSSSMWVIRDWKVNGYCGKNATSPKKGYTIIRDGDPDFPSRGANKAHKAAVIEDFDGIGINTAMTFHQINVTWADQLTMYAWMLGVPIGERFIAGIEQCVAKPTGEPGVYPDLRFARFQSYVEPDAQHTLWTRLKHMWASVSAGFIFNGICDRAESDRRCAQLDELYKKTDNPELLWLQGLTRDNSYYG